MSCDPSPHWPTTTNPELFEQAGQALPEEDVVVGQRDPDAGFGHPY